MKQSKRKIVALTQIILLLCLISILIPSKSHADVKKGKKTKGPSEPILNVKLGVGFHSEVKVSFPYGGQITNDKGKRIKNLKPGESFAWKLLNKNKKKIDYLNENLHFNPKKSLFIFNSNEYRGNLYVNFFKTGAIVINKIGIEEYLRGVVGSEMGARSPEESLKAQTVIARTYAYSHRKRHNSEGADVCNTTHCQVYSGKKSEHENVDKAVKNTRGYVLTHNGVPISALYHATCGGMTSDNDKVFGGAPLDYLRRVNCPFCQNGTKYRWNQEISVQELRTALAKEGVKLEETYGVLIEAPEKMDRVSQMIFQTKKGEQGIKGTTIRRIFNLPSTTFIIAENTKDKSISVSDETSKVRLDKEPSKLHITTLSEYQNPPKQLIVYCSGGLIRVKKPEEGWKCISYEKKNILSDSKSKIKRSSNSEKFAATTAIRSVSKNKEFIRPLNKINLFGRGFGHQVGLCQSGAVEMGKKGWTYRQILAHYYNKKVILKKLGY